MRALTLAFVLTASGCGKAPPPAPDEKPVAAPKPDKPPAPEPLTYARVKSAVPASAGKQVSWRGKLVRRLERADKAGHAMYYLLFAEDPERKGNFASSRPFLVDEAKATVGTGVEAAFTKEGSIIYSEGNTRWAALRCDEVVLTVTGTVSGETEFQTDLDGLPRSAPLLAPATIKLAAEK
jgi:hypothetical protein